jgi:hypothetical protein
MVSYNGDVRRIACLSCTGVFWIISEYLYRALYTLRVRYSARVKKYLFSSDVQHASRQDRSCNSHNTTVRPRVKKPLFTLLHRSNPLFAKVTLRRVLWIRVILWFQSGGGTFEHALACVGVEEVVLGAGAQNRCPVGAVPVLAAVVGVDVLEVVFGTDGGCLACYAAPLRSSGSASSSNAHARAASLKTNKGGHSNNRADPSWQL